MTGRFHFHYAQLEHTSQPRLCGAFSFLENEPYEFLSRRHDHFGRYRRTHYLVAVLVDHRLVRHLQSRAARWRYRQGRRTQTDHYRA
ncbi:hypothetical protein EMIT093MI4_170063 [Pseudomonas sp. IT-93MI4]